MKYKIDSNLLSIQASRSLKIGQIRQVGIVQMHIVNDRPGHPDEMLASLDWIAGIANISVNPYCFHEDSQCSALRNPQRVNVGYDSNASWRLIYKSEDCYTKLAVMDLHPSDDGSFEWEIVRMDSIVVKVVQTTRDGSKELQPTSR